MRKVSLEIILTTIGTLLGLLFGYMYFIFIGCKNGCPIKSNPWLMTAYGGVMGGLLVSLIYSIIKPKNK